MAKVKIKIELNDKDIIDIVCEKYNITKDSATININHSKGDQREPEYTQIIIEGIKIEK